MPPKKESAKKTAITVFRPPISNSSLVYVPEGAVKGFQERIETGIEWALVDEAARHHRLKYSKNKIPFKSFSTALKNKIKNSVLNSFLDENNSLSLQDQWELLLPITLWDTEKFGNEEKKICFENDNNITDNLVKLIKKAVFLNDRKVLERELKLVNTLRIIGAEMTMLDSGLTEFVNLSTLNLCGNYIDMVSTSVLPPGLRALELQANRISKLEHMAQKLPENLLYLGLARNLLTNESFEGLQLFHSNIRVLDFSDNDIYDLEPVLNILAALPNLTALQLAGNPCSVCSAYAQLTLTKLPRLQWLDSRQILPTDQPQEPFEPHPHDLRSTYFYFTVFRIMGVLQPPKPEKGTVANFHVELELPLLDPVRRQFLMFRRHESLTELLPPPEDEEIFEEKLPSRVNSKVTSVAEGEQSPHESDIYRQLVTKNPLEIHNFTTFESNRVPWSKMLSFQEPIIKIFCPDLLALRDTFRTIVTIRLVYTLHTTSSSKSKADKKGDHSIHKMPTEQRVTLASIRCALRKPDWSQPSQHFHWDDTLGTNDAIHWGDGDLSILQYTQAPLKPTPKSAKNKSLKAKAKSEVELNLQSTRQLPPDNLTCHFGFGIHTLSVFDHSNKK